MDRRNFIKVSAITGAATALESCSHPEHQLIRFIPEDDLVPGIATWKPSLCTLCPAGCGLLVRVMEGDAEVIRNGQLGLMKMGLAKKLEGNPNHPVNRGKLCARGQAGLQVTYHPDRIRHPLKLSGPRGSGQYREASWDEALHDVQAQLESLHAANESAALALLSKPLRGQRRVLVEQFLKSFGAPPPVYFSLFDEAVERWANLYSFGRPQTSTLDLARANYVISFGADFLGTWNSPVAQNAGYGIMRQGRPGRRAKLVQVEPRLSQTGANADEWIPARPGTDAWLALGIAHVVLNEKLVEPPRNSAATELIAGWNEGLPQFTPQAVEGKTGVPAETVQRLAREIAAHLPAVVFAGGESLAQTNGSFTALAVNALNALLGSVENAGGLFFAPPVPTPARAAATPILTPQGGYNQIADLVQQIIIGSRAPKALFLHDANPVYAAPDGANLRSTLGKIPFIASFGSFLDETSSLADLILPDHSPLESWLDDKTESGTTQAVLTLAP
ncbi:MAG TPA: molybdopterin-dependent oxidoreductase, partial [Terriglobia bacterium]|nr:molybdopterin-dependent oxidoreductase [Terriglobia bacterium]